MGPCAARFPDEDETRLIVGAPYIACAALSEIVFGSTYCTDIEAIGGNGGAMTKSLVLLLRMVTVTDA